ncbi:class I SAM-dependent methyltransferase [Gillisia hiemivivida]|uniref:Class I SAM-dependent methyltransferase n=1 Tax=Gillisia hiemivivida TaxID=291190 RepID=A0A5C6ZUH9_9FLAO|nr:class I SAM-dependent methyltransferase [Gillisia hiemivivida]TXD92862.1 class I SAM-dependent methyltransferase [Gillisia hiemivivida]
MNNIKPKFEYQENQYVFPYHHIAYLDKQNNAVNYRTLTWGFKYFCYLLHCKKIIESLDLNSVLDVGCGEGRFLGLLDDGIIRKVGVDLSKRAIGFARAFHPGVEFLTKDASEIEEKFDMVTAIEVLEHIPDEEVNGFFNKLAAKTNDGGRILISVPTKVKPVSAKHYRHYDLELFQNQLQAANIPFEIEKVDYVYKEPKWLKLYSKMTNNKFGTLQIKFFNDLIWKFTQKNLCITNAKHGEELIILLKKLQ